MISKLHIAGLSVALQDSEPVLAELEAIYVEFAARQASYRQHAENPHLCFEGCSACCKTGAFFAVTLVEALRWALAVRELPDALRDRARMQAREVLAIQEEAFGRLVAQPDVPGRRDEVVFSRRVSSVAKTGIGCPLLHDDRCSVYAGRPFLCRGYGFPVDAYAVEAESAIVFRSLCTLYSGIALRDYVRARDLHAQLVVLSQRLSGGWDQRRFTSAEAILAEVE